MKQTGSILTLGSIASAVILSGCTGIASITGSNKLSLHSNPSGAEVYIMGQPVGTTPIDISQQTLYPSAYPNDMQHLYGVVVLKNAGCEDYSRRVNSGDISRGVNAILNCKGGSASSNRSTQLSTTSTSPADTDTAPGHTDKTTSMEPADNTERSVKQRLQQINELRDDGLINDSEYQTIRQRILDSL